MFNLQHKYITYEKKLPFIDIVNKSGLLMLSYLLNSRVPWVNIYHGPTSSAENTMD
jgi:hypothetical protein